MSRFTQFLTVDLLTLLVVSAILAWSGLAFAIPAVLIMYVNGIITGMAFR